MASEDTAPARRRFRLGGRRWLRYLLIVAGIVSLLVAAGGAVAALWAFTILPRTLPSVTALETFQPLVGTKLYDDNDELITELHVERRIFVPLAHIPQSLRDAVIATEDKRFYYHWGIRSASGGPSPRTTGADGSSRAAARSPSSSPSCSSSHPTRASSAR